ncbi:MAG: ABC transporter permease [Alistipes sp.]|nr:ABC transporter permease [Alistipes sp.]
MVRIATAAVAVSIAVVVISLAVIFGFKEQISALVSGTVADITVSEFAGKQSINDTEALRRIISSTENVAHIERYALRGCVIRGEKGAAGLALKGIDADADLSFVDERLESGTTPRIEEARRKEILLSQSIASKIGAKTNSRVELLLLEDGTPRREVFKVCGLYNSALGDTGAELALTDIRNVQKLNGWESSQISGYNCLLHDNQFSGTTADIINLRLMREYEGEESIVAESSRDKYTDIFGWLETHDINAAVITTIMLIVAIFNMVTAILILVLERTRMVGILKSLGMQNRTIRQIFTHRAARIIGVGIAIGNALALALLLLQQRFHLVKLDEEGYFLSEIPVALDAWWIVAVNVAFVAIVLAATHLATAIVGRIKVAEAIKYN